MSNIDVLEKAEELDNILKASGLFSLGLNVRYVVNNQMLMALERFAIYKDEGNLTPQLFGIPFRVDKDMDMPIKAEIW